MYNEMFARTVLDERGREREVSMHLDRLHGRGARRVRRRPLRRFLRLPRFEDRPRYEPVTNETMCVDRALVARVPDARVQLAGGEYEAHLPLGAVARAGDGSQPGRRECA